MPDAYGNPTEEDLRLYGYAPQGQVPYVPYNPGSFTPDGSGYNADTQAAVDARNNSGISTRDRYDGNGQLISHDERATPTRDNSPNAPSFQGAFMDDPFYQRSDVKPLLAATNRDTLGGGAFGTRAWLRDHPVGTIAAFIAAAAGGAAASGWGAGAGAEGAGGIGGGAAGGGGGGAAGGGLSGGELGGLGGWGGGTQSGLGVFGGGGTGGLAGVGGGNAGALAAAGGITGGAGTGIGGSLGGGSGWLSQGNIKNYTDLLGMANGGKDQGGGQMQIPWNAGFMGNQAQPQQQASPQFIGLPTQQYQPYIPSRGYNAHNFYGSTVWS